MRSKGVKRRRWNFRVDPESDRLVRQAAATSQRTLTDFVVGAAVLDAERLLADGTEFALQPQQWERFVELLDRSPRDKPRARKALPGAAGVQLLADRCTRQATAAATR